MDRTPWPVEEIPEEERAIIDDTTLPVERRHEMAMRYLWGLRATESNQREEIHRLRDALEQIASRADTEYWEGPDPDFGDLMSIENIAREALHGSTSRVRNVSSRPSSSVTTQSRW